jgi:hypothetical protein
VIGFESGPRQLNLARSPLTRSGTSTACPAGAEAEEGRGAVALAEKASDAMFDKAARTGLIDWQLADLSGTGHRRPNLPM